MIRPQTTERPRVVIVGAGFAGLSAARRLMRRRDLDLVIIDRNNYHTFQPLLYQVAAAELESSEVANPLRGLFRRRRQVAVLMTEVCGADLERRILYTNGPEIRYDYLVLAAGSVGNFFGTSGAAEHAFTLKSMDDAVRLRNHLLCCFERAALLTAESHANTTTPSDSPDPGEATSDRDRLFRIVVVGGGPTGIEYAGALAELIRTPLARDFHEFPPGSARVTLLEAADQVLPGFPPRLTDYAVRRLERMGVEVRIRASVAEVRPDSVVLADGTEIFAATTVWTAGACGNPLAATMGLPLAKGARVAVAPTLQVEAHPEVFVVGDLSIPEGERCPMVAPNAIQQGALAGDNIVRLLLRKEPLKPFVYRDKGSVAVIGRGAAVVSLGRFGFSGLLAWLLWLFIHLSYLVGFHNKISVMIAWAWDYLFAERTVRLIVPGRCACSSTKKTPEHDKDTSKNSPPEPRA